MGVRYGAYDSLDRKWHFGTDALPYADYSDLMMSNGVLAYLIDLYSVDQSVVRYAAYDPGDHDWHRASDERVYTVYSNLVTADGIVAFERENTFTGLYSVGYAAYDGGDHSWHTSHHGEYSSVSDLAVSGGKVSWTADGKGYSYLVARKPRAYFSADRTSGAGPLYVQFSDNSVGSISSWEWDFGDGSNSSSERSPSHTFSTAGSHTVTLTVSGPGGNHSAKMTIIVSSAQPTATPTRTPTPTAIPSRTPTPTPRPNGVGDWMGY